MSKIKVYELAKELDVPSKEVIEFLGGKNIEVKNHMSSLEDADADMARKALTKGNKDAAAKPEAEAPKKAGRCRALCHENRTHRKHSTALK